MEPADLGVILDSSITIEAERQQLNVAQFLRQIIQKIGDAKPLSAQLPLLNWPTGSIEPIHPTGGTAAFSWMS